MIECISFVASMVLFGHGIGLFGRRWLFVKVSPSGNLEEQMILIRFDTVPRQELVLSHSLVYNFSLK